MHYILKTMIKKIPILGTEKGKANDNRYSGKYWWINLKAPGLLGLGR
jgi:hypothetical protein